VITNEDKVLLNSRVSRERERERERERKKEGTKTG